MISAREFCRERGYPITIFLTYSLDPLFFERIPIDDLDVGGSRRIIIAADAGEVAEAMRRCLGQIVYLGRRYVLAETKAANTFHPKMIARLSQTGGRVWVGSGNLTYTGWGGNQEIAAAWSVGPNTPDGGAWLNDVLTSVGSVTKSATFLSQIDAVRSSVRWLSIPPAATEKSPVLLGMPNHPLGPQLAQRWKDRQFSEVKIFTGSTDVDGAFLLWAHRTFGIKKATICLSPAYASFDPGKLSKFPFKVCFVESDPKRLMHAKFYWFSGPDGNAALMGSANCSAAAWLSKHDAGNVELVVSYDDAVSSDFKEVLALFDSIELSPAQILETKSAEGKASESEWMLGYRIVSLRLRSSGRTIETTIEPTPPEEGQVFLIIDFETGVTRLKLAPRGNGFAGRLPADVSIGVATVFATIEIISSGQSIFTPPRWIDNEPALERAVRDRDVDPNLQELSRRDFGNAGQQRIMEAIYAVSADLLKADPPEFSKLSADTSGLGLTGKDKGQSDEVARPIDPGAILFSLKELVAEKWGATSRGHVGLDGVSLQGVISMLFSTDEEPEIDLSHEKWEGDDTEDEPGDNGAGRNSDKESNKTPSITATTSETLAAFRNQIDYFLFELAKPTYADSCTAGRLMQAMAFPILLCAKVNEAGWLPDGMLASVATRVVDIMLTKSYGRGKPKGLFRQVQTRYVASGEEDAFLQTVGEGALWAALLASLARMETESLSSLIRQAAAITSVLACSELVATSSADQLALFVRTLIIRDAEFAVTERAVKLADAMNRLTSLLANNWDSIYSDQGNGRPLHAGGSIMWSPDWGWEILPRSPAQCYFGGYINLELAANKSPEIRSALDALWEAMRTSGEERIGGAAL